ncbi:MAG: hypothetical protein JWQ35_116 [Bacteriovoracaceae bacterium]|nr:hypothetical protein [Bacteriovoracaceae bacterium]
MPSTKLIQQLKNRRVFFISFFLTAALTQATESNMKKIEVQGHRGARARAPENTLPAFQHALEIGADGIELDMAVTKDQVIVISHNPFISREICLDQNGSRLSDQPLIHSLTLAEVKSYDCGTIQNSKFPNQVPVPKTKIPTLEEVFSLVQNSPLPAAKTLRFNIETKIYSKHPKYTVDPKTFTDLAIKAFKESGFIDRIILESFDPRTLVLAKEQEPTLKTSLLVDHNVWSKIRVPFFHPNLLSRAKRFGVDIISPNYELIVDHPEIVDKLQKSGIQVFPWTVNDPNAWNKLIAMKVDGIITDDPAMLLKTMGRIN